ncbi:endonuclease [Thaumasiovibrio sp. DFM-14]|uniref:endonuclease n=1 Tax=Thaumasiovibrio sp. DFM-14 TaxID=3384792 RepID=UPI0039A14D79
MKPMYKVLAASLPLVLAGCAHEHEEDTTRLVVKIHTDSSAHELSWKLYDSDAELLRTGSGYRNNSYYEIPMDLLPEAYRFVLEDSGNDGICCTDGSGSVELVLDGEQIAYIEDTDLDGEVFLDEHITRFTVGGYTKHLAANLREEYIDAEGFAGYELKTALHQIAKGTHDIQSVARAKGFIAENDLDRYYGDKEATHILDMFSKNPTGDDPYQYLPTVDECSDSSIEEGVCYEATPLFRTQLLRNNTVRNPMDRDIHHIFPMDSGVNHQQLDNGSPAIPYGYVSEYSKLWESLNGTQYGYGDHELGNRSHFVFEPIDEFKGDVARALLYLAVRYEDVIEVWSDVSTSNQAIGRILDGSKDQVFNSWQIKTLMQWHEEDPVSQKERDRNDAAQEYQGNRNPFIDHPELVNKIWRTEGHRPFSADED